MNWSIFSITLADNISNFFSFFELMLSIIYFIVAFLNLLVDTSETFGILVLVTFILLHQFNLLVYIHNLSSNSQPYTVNINSDKFSLSKLYLPTFLLATLSRQ